MSTQPAKSPAVCDAEREGSSPDATTAAEWLRRRAIYDPEHPALSFDGVTLSYGELQRSIERVSAVFAALAIGRGDRVAYAGGNHAIVPIALFAAARIGAILVPLNCRLSGAELAAIVCDAGARTLIADDLCAPLLDPLRGELPCKRYLHLSTTSPGWDSLDALMDSVVSIPDAVHAQPGDVAALMYTSGTTGEPKGVMLTHHNLWAANLNGILTADLTSRDVTLVCVPLFHAAGLCVLLLPTLMAGGHVVLQRGFDAGAVLNELERSRVTITMLVPAMMLFISRDEAFHRADLSALRRIVAGGAPVPEPLLKTYGERGLPISQCYGMTESTAIATALDTSKAASKIGSCGRAAPMTQVQLVDGVGQRIVEAGVRGELWIRGAHVTPGYWNRSAATAAAFTDGWFHTGDIGYFDADGFYTICDRLKDMIISGGENVYPAEVEGVLSEHPAIAEIAVIGAPDERWGEAVVAVVVPKTGATLQIDALRTYGERRLARYKLPSALHLIDAMPRNSTGKLLKSELRKRFSGPAAYL